MSLSLWCYGCNRFVKLTDFSQEVDVLPVADPDVFSLSQRFTMAQAQLQIASSNPAMHDMREAYYRVYEALGTKQINSLLKPSTKPKPTDPAIENSNAMKGMPIQAFADQDHDAHIGAHIAFMNTRMVQVNPAVYGALQAHIMEHISFKARAQVMIEIKTNRPDLVELEQRNSQAYLAETENMIAEQIAGLTAEYLQQEGGQQQDPLVALKQKELDLRAMDIQRRANENMQEENRKSQEFAEKIDLEKMKREDAEEASKERIRVADEKLNLQEIKIMADMDKDQRSVQ